MSSSGIIGIIVAFVIFVGIGLVGCPTYRVYSAEMSGRALLAEAQSSRQIANLEAKAKLESAKSLAAADIIRAEGAATANRVLQNSLGGPEGYLRYLQIQALEDSKASLIYVPTEAGLPMTESGRIRSNQAPAEAE